MARWPSAADPRVDRGAQQPEASRPSRRTRAFSSVAKRPASIRLASSHLLLRVEQRDLADLLQVVLDRVSRGAGNRDLLLRLVLDVGVRDLEGLGLTGLRLARLRLGLHLGEVLGKVDLELSFEGGGLCQLAACGLRAQRIDVDDDLDRRAVGGLPRRAVGALRGSLRGGSLLRSRLGRRGLLARRGLLRRRDVVPGSRGLGSGGLLGRALGRGLDRGRSLPHRGLARLNHFGRNGLLRTHQQLPLTSTSGRASTRRARERGHSVTRPPAGGHPSCNDACGSVCSLSREVANPQSVAMWADQALTARTGMGASSRMAWEFEPRTSFPTGLRRRIPITMMSASSSSAMSRTSLTGSLPRTR